MKKLLLYASVVLVCYFASDVAKGPTYPAPSATPIATIQIANK